MRAALRPNQYFQCDFTSVNLAHHLSDKHRSALDYDDVKKKKKRMYRDETAPCFSKETYRIRMMGRDGGIGCMHTYYIQSQSLKSHLFDKN